MENIINKVKETIKIKPNAIIGIDGCCASGKTTLAAQLAEHSDAQVIHMDDFFLLPEMRTEQRLSEPGGNVHYERFIDEVISGIESGNIFEYRAFSCKTGRFGESKTILPDKPIIIEGAYAFHPEIPDIFDLKIFMKVDYDTQLKRIFERNGSGALDAFKAKWIPLENKYFSSFNIEAKCDITIENE